MFAAYVIFRALVVLFGLLKGGPLGDIGELAQGCVALCVLAVIGLTVYLAVDMLTASAGVAEYLPVLP